MPLPNTRVKAVCDYPLFSDIEGSRWIEKMMTRAVELRNIIDWDLISVQTNNMGLQLLIFTVELKVPAKILNDTKRTRRYIERTMNEGFYDSDVSVRMMNIKN